MGDERPLNERFAESGGAPIQVGDRTVHIWYRREIAARATFKVHRVATNSKYVQGLALRVKPGKLDIDGDAARSFHLWEDRAPSTVLFAVRSRGPVELAIWNLWRMNDQTWAWSHNAAC